MLVVLEFDRVFSWSKIVYFLNLCEVSIKYMMEYTTLNSLTRKEKYLKPIWKHHSFYRNHEYMASECMQKIIDCHLIHNYT